MQFPDLIETLKRRTFYGREKDNVVYPIGLANLVLHQIDEPHIWHGNTLSGAVSYGGLFTDAPQLFDVILMNPPFGGKEGKDAQKNFPYKTGATQVLFLQHVLGSLREGGRCAMVIDEGILFRTTEEAFTKTKKKLLDECDLWCIVSLPAGVFTAAGAGVKTNLLFFTKGGHTDRIWYYDLSDVRVGKKNPLTLKHFEEFFASLPARADSGRSWTVSITERKAAARRHCEPLRAQTASLDDETARLNERIKELKKARPVDEERLAALTARVADLNRQSGELKGKAKAIEDGVYDLKAVNPNVRNEEDTRTPEQLIEIIEMKGREVAEALEALRALKAEHSSANAPAAG